ncbi:hypothetical protein PMAYCL1PPCAC_29371 [Pristionchus mayeri]|uniref:UV-stimulated scaffold protein A C-terminal domain-containing protein n=1 Tax=Pristionchus mayeri TaxID=1317129 RepID=A0AAN5IE28_9BILA|nr:hypothetical protein PMAYCL1PPCAC_29371 [Pristionchus mayeri]
MDKLTELNLRLQWIIHRMERMKTSSLKCPMEEMVENMKKINQAQLPVHPSRESRFGLDLKYWGQEKQMAEFPVNNADCHRFWRPPDESEERNGRTDIYESRVFTYIGVEQRGEKKCGARLKNGDLCPRMDVIKCPIPRKNYRSGS